MLQSLVLSGLAALSLFSTPSFAALKLISDFKGATQVQMYVHEPTTKVEKPPIIVMVHFCLGSASAYYSMASGYQSLANQKGIILIYPNTNLDNHCWDVATPETLKHEGGGDSQSIVQMVQHAIKKYDADPQRVYVTGSSSGAMMTNVLAATYPDIFKAAAAFSGVAHGCLGSQTMSKDKNTGRTAPNHSSPMSDKSGCPQGGLVGATWEPKKWGDLVRNSYPDYKGTYPKIQIWHGTSDKIVTYNNLAYMMKQWSDVHGVAFSKNITDDPQTGYTKMVYGDGSKVVGYSAQGVGHTVPQHPKEVLEWFGL